mmetsp:Transcript_84920/g.172186  ORF Transcript_84920/g.172186 Transcript_84920/m.172186 type:complete len:259 (-) Transcript_84920:182-958(-)
MHGPELLLLFSDIAKRLRHMAPLRLQLLHLLLHGTHACSKTTPSRQLLLHRLELLPLLLHSAERLPDLALATRRRSRHLLAEAPLLLLHPCGRGRHLLLVFLMFRRSASQALLESALLLLHPIRRACRLAPVLLVLRRQHLLEAAQLRELILLLAHGLRQGGRQCCLRGAGRRPGALIAELIHALPEGVQHRVRGAVGGHAGGGHLAHGGHALVEAQFKVVDCRREDLPAALLCLQRDEDLIELLLQALGHGQHPPRS